MKNPTPEELDDVLPQTQCGLCGYGGCMPYAEAMVFEKAPINLCPPGGVKTMQVLGELLNQDSIPFITEMELKTKPKMLALIREAECIGCTKCIQACPVDAILGSAKQMHTVIASECTGCELCVAPCPVDCIEMVTIFPTAIKIEDEKKIAHHARTRFQARQKRLEHEKQATQTIQEKTSINKKQDYIATAIARAKAKKLSSI